MTGETKEILITPNPKQQSFFESTARYTAYGGARGGGKSWAMRMKLVLLALGYDGIQILLLRRTLGELRENHLFPLLSLLDGIAKYASTEKPVGDITPAECPCAQKLQDQHRR